MFCCMAVATLTAQRMPKLKEGDRIAFVAPSWNVNETQMSSAIDFFERNGFQVVLGNHLYEKHHHFSATDEHRLEDMQTMLDDTTIKAIICVRGGYGAIRFVDQLDFTRFRQHPKWICGFSDISVLHAQVLSMGFPALHSVMPITIKKETADNPYTQSLLSALRGEMLHYEFDPNASNRSGQAEGVLVGGNLSIIYSLLGSSSDLDTDGKILFIEDTDEYLYHIDRMMRALKRAGKLDHLKGLVVGCMNKLHDNDIPLGQNIQEIILSVCEEYDFPICFDFPAGHGGRNFALPLGRTAKLEVSPSGCSLTFPMNENH